MHMLNSNGKTDSYCKLVFQLLIVYYLDTSDWPHENSFYLWPFQRLETLTSRLSLRNTLNLYFCSTILDAWGIVETDIYIVHLSFVDFFLLLSVCFVLFRNRNHRVRNLIVTPLFWYHTSSSSFQFVFIVHLLCDSIFAIYSSMWLIW